MDKQVSENRTHRGWPEFFAPSAAGWAGPLNFFCLGLTLSLLLCIYFQWGGPDFVEAYTNVVQIVVYVGNFLLTWRVARHPSLEGRARLAWRLIAAACLCYMIASIMWGYFEVITKTQPFPSWTDPFYLLFYALIVPGLLLVVPPAASREERLKMVLDAGIVTLGSAMLIWYYVLQPIAAGAEDDVLKKALSVAYPVCDLTLLFSVLVVLFKRPEPDLRRTMNYLLGGAFVIFFADLLFVYQSLQGTFMTGTLADAFYAVSGLLVVWAAHIQYLNLNRPAEKRAAPAERLSHSLIWLPYCAIAAGYALLLSFVYDRLDEVLGQLVVIAGALVALVIVRQLLAIRENIRSQESLRELQERFQGIYDSSKDAIAFSNPDGRLVDVNGAFAALLGYTREELLDGRTFTQLTPPEYQRATAKYVAQIFEHDRPAEYEKEYFRKDGSRVPVEVTAFAVKSSDGKPMGSAAIIRDITERREHENRLRHDALHDALTGLPNRTLFLEHLKSAIARRRRDGDPNFAVLFLDFDRFKVINDSLGHLEGDKLLKQIAARLEGSIRRGDVVARLGGDEFTVLLNHLETEADTELIVARIEETLRAPFPLTEREVFTSASIGIAVGQPHYTKPDEMLRDADTAMYYAKEAGKAQHRFFTAEMHDRATRRLELENELRPAIENGEICLFYQPIVETRTGRITGFEALARWRHPVRGLIAPAEFVPIAEETGLIVPLGAFVLAEAARQLRRWQEEFPACRDLTMSVNLSSRQFVQNDLYGSVAAAVRDAQIAPSCLHLEVTESILLKDRATAVEVMQRLRTLGVRFSIDDFGTGYSSLSYLHQLPIDYLKIDRSFVSGLEDKNDNLEIIRSILTLAQSVGIEVIAEGIENDRELDLLRELGCKFGQGYHFFRPAPAAAVAGLLGPDEAERRAGGGPQPFALCGPLTA